MVRTFALVLVAAVCAGSFRLATGAPYGLVTWTTPATARFAIFAVASRSSTSQLDSATVHRLWNNRADSNHRYTVRFAYEVASRG